MTSSSRRTSASSPRKTGWRCFAKRGFYRNFSIDTSFLTPWAVLFERAPAGDPATAVREYDRVYLRQRREIDELRAAMIKFSADLDEAYGDTAPQVASLSEANHALEEQLASLHSLHDDLQVRHHDLAAQRDSIALERDRLHDARNDQVDANQSDRQEVLRLRDLLIGLEQEHGGALGRITELESELNRYGKLPDQYRDVVESTTWRLAWKVMGPYRRLRTMQAERGAHS